MGNEVSKELCKFVVKDAHPTGTEISRGSYGVVYEIKMDGHGMCAGKVFHKELFADSDSDFIHSKYLQECQLMSELDHPNITKFIGVCYCQSISPLPVLLMEKLERNLDDYLSLKTSEIPLAIKISILQDVAKGLVYLHEHDPPIIHKDLIARNVLLTMQLKAKITDFCGNSLFVNLRPGQLHTTSCMGTPVYMPPEVCVTSTPPDPSLDIFSFGHLALYVGLQIFPNELLEPNYKDQNSGEQQFYSEVKRRREYFKELETRREFAELDGYSIIHKHPLVGTIEKCLANDPKERYNAKDLLATLDEMNISEDANACLGELIEHWNKKATRPDPVVLVVAGKAGVGKSTLINNFLHLNSSKQAKTGLDGDHVTTEVSEYKEELNGITVKIIDTPGLYAMDLPEATVTKTIAMLNAYTDGGKADLIFYCVSMVGGRIDEGDVNIIKTLTKAFGDKIWEQCILVLTRADNALEEVQKTEKEVQSEEHIMQRFNEIIGTFCKAFQQASAKAGVSTITSVQSGLSMKNKQPDPSTLIAMPAGRKPDKPPEWVPLLFREVLKKCNADAIPAMLTLQGMKWKKMAYILSMNYVFRVTNFTLETAAAVATSHFGMDGPMKKVLSAGIDYATVVRARSIVSQKRKENKKETLGATAKFYVKLE